METAWLFDRLAITVAGVDFVDPALAGDPDVRERGVRVEVRPLATAYEGSVYASASHKLRPASCRIDLLESAPYAADRMHWHPVMYDGEPGDRVFEPAMVTDPLAWLAGWLADVDDAVRVAVPDIVDLVGRLLQAARVDPWPEVTRDVRGLSEIVLPVT